MVNQTKILNNQKLILKQFARFGTMFDNVLKHNNLTNPIVSTKNSTNQEFDKSQNKPEQYIIQPINSLDELRALENKLEDITIMTKYKDKLSFICGRGTKGNGIDHCYYLIDILFTRKFFTLCSWAGGSRDSSEKIPFKVFRNTITFFYTLIQEADKDFTLVQCETFFKNVIRNSTRRSESDRLKQSKSKKRPKSLQYRPKVQVQSSELNQNLMNIE